MKQNMKNNFLLLLLISTLFTPIYHIFANDISIYVPEFFTSSGEHIPVHNLSISASVMYDAQGFWGCLQSQQSIVENEAYDATIYGLKNEYQKYLVAIDWNKLTQPRVRCAHDSDAMLTTRTYPMQVYVNYGVAKVQWYIANSNWKLLIWIQDSKGILEYPTSFFSTRSNQGPDRVWYSDGTTWDYGSATSSHIMRYLATGSGGIFSTSGHISWTGITSFVRKSWNGTVILNSQISAQKRETIRFHLWNPNTLIRWTFDVFMYPGWDKVELELYRNNILIKKLKKNTDFWVRPSRIEAGKYIIFHPERFYAYWDEVRISFNPLTY